MRTVVKINTSILMLLVVAFAAACSQSKDKAATAAATEEFHKRFNNSAFGDIYDQAEPGVRKRQSREDFLASMQAMRQGQGAVIEAKEIAVDYNYSTDGKMIKQLYEVTYQKGIAKEEFIHLDHRERKRHSSQLSISWASAQPLIVEAEHW